MSPFCVSLAVVLVFCGTLEGIDAKWNLPGLQAPPRQFDCPQPGGAFPHPEKCEQFYRCIEGVGTLETCPNKQLFDLVYNGCNHDYLVDCGDRERPEGGGENPNPDFTCPQPGGAFPHPEKCEQFYRCVEGVGTLETCPNKQLFDLVYNGCNHDYLVDCGDRERPGGDGENPNPDFTCPQPGGAFPHPEKCELFYRCVEGDATLESCPNPQLFDLVYDGCNHPELVDCGDRERPDGENPNPNPDFDCPELGGAFPHPEKCELFYRCVEGVATLETCPNPQLFDLVYDGCNHPELVDCGDRERPGENPGGPDFVCPRPNGNFADPEYCHRYFICSNNVPTGQECQAGLLWDDTIAGCELEERVDCGDRLRPTNAPPTQEPPSEFECPVAYGYFPDPKNCRAYYVCNNFFEVHNVCGDDLLFHETALVCAHPYQVTCGDRPILS